VSRTELHQLLDAVPEGDLDAVRRAIEPFVDPLLLTLATADVDDEPTTAEEDDGAEEAWQEYVRGESRPWAAVRDELSPDDCGYRLLPL
jgi:hypothetical protein